ncbi:hypothetical protein A5721_11110 [Mycobacterium vulneris]|nr:hypothetical protein A5721_11110 [Mycolicibacterium vulneris]
MADPAIDAAQRAYTINPADATVWDEAVTAAREALKPIREHMSLIKDRYENVRRMMLAAETSAEMSRHANEMAGIEFAYNLIAPLIYASEELER